MEYNNAINTAGYGEREMISIMYVIWVTYES